MSNEVDRRRRGVLMGAAVGAPAAGLALLAGSEKAGAMPPPGPDVFSVKVAHSLPGQPAVPPAVGDGIVDDTAAIRRAIDAATAAGDSLGARWVYLPMGIYRVTGNLDLKGVQFGGPPGHMGAPKPMIRHDMAPSAETGEAFIRLTRPGASISDVRIDYKQQGGTTAAPVVAFPFTISMEHSDCTVRRVYLPNSFQGIRAIQHDAGQNQPNAGRFLIEDITGQVLKTGISLDGPLDAGRIQRVHFWPFTTNLSQIHPGLAAYTQANGTALDVGKADWFVVNDFFAFGFRCGMRLRMGTYGASNGVITNLQFDQTYIGISAEVTQETGVSVVNYEYTGQDRLGGYGIHAPGTAGGERATLSIHGGNCWGGWTEGFLLWRRQGLISIDGVTVAGWKVNPANASGPTNASMTIEQGRAVISNCVFLDGYESGPLGGTFFPAVSAKNTCDRVMITGNQLVGHPILNSSPFPFPALPYTLNHL